MSVFACRILIRSLGDHSPVMPNTSLANEARWSMARMKRGSSADGTQLSFGVVTVGRPASLGGSLVDPAIECAELLRRPGSVTGHRPVLQLAPDGRGVGHDGLVRPEVESPTHRIAVLFAKQRADVGREGHGCVRRR